MASASSSSLSPPSMRKVEGDVASLPASSSNSPKKPGLIATRSSLLRDSSFWLAVSEPSSQR
eukprot:3142464-Heterocapsa_arctica.AAC.1